ncbi:MAG: acetolactate synthase large subunit [Gammaproteobacteria bacterium 28-57-27]|nr:MAG: acetolactate synthase large subunit [Gammaproteobacteria bacterium 28-57-27]
MTTAELFIRCLEAEGVETIFGVPGEENLDLLDALLESTIRFIPTRHEQGAAFMADVHGRLTGRAGVCLATLGPGATNLITGVADANMDNAPLVAIAGQASTERLHKESHQVLDLVEMFRPITKYSTRVLTPGTVPETIRKAFKLAQASKPGAAFIELPENIAEMLTEGTPLMSGKEHHPGPTEETVCEAAKLISLAKNPIILAGNGVIRARAHEALAAFAGHMNIPVANTFMAKGVIPFKHPMALGSVGLQAKDYVGVGFDHADLIIAIGYDIVEYHPHLWHPTRDRAILHIDDAAAEVDAHYGVTLEVLGDIGLSLERIALRAKPHEGQALRKLRGLLKADMSEHSHDTLWPMKPQKLIWDLRTALDLHDIVISDVGAHKMWLARMFRCEFPNTCIISNGFASMGIALPGAIAAKLACPQRTVVAATGDGGFLMNVQELETAVRLGTPIIVLIWNDGGYGLIEWKQIAQFGRPAFVKFGNPDFVKLAEAFGARGYRIEPGMSLQDVLREAIASNDVCVIDVPVDYSENLKLTARLGEMISPM